MYRRRLLEKLEQWRIDSHRKPLVIRGARQVGKTTLVNQFGKQFKQYIHVNLERPEDAALFKTKTSMEVLVQNLLLRHNMQRSAIADTLLFIDEIQESPEVVNLLRYFYEDIPELAVIAAGSMIENVHGTTLTFPVGRVEFLVLRPVSFEEFLFADEQHALIDAFQQMPVQEFAYTELFKAFHRYAYLGGMPEVLARYLERKDLTALVPVYESLMTTYLNDVEKYARNEAQTHVIRHTIQQAMLNAGKRISFSGLGQQIYPSKSIGEVLRALEKAHLVSLVYPTTSAIPPCIPDHGKTPRIQVLDTGLANFMADIQRDLIGIDDLSSIYQGTLIEHLVGQELLSFQSGPLSKLNFWVRQKNQSDAEVDFIYPYQGMLVPVEVKSGAHGTLRSLHVFMDQSPLTFAIRFYGGPFQLTTCQTALGKHYTLVNLPYFLASRIDYYIRYILLYPPEAPVVSSAKEPEMRYPEKAVSIKPDASIVELDERHWSVLAACLDGPRKASELLTQVLGLTHQTRNRRLFLSPLVSQGYLHYHEDSSSRAPAKSYTLTANGNRLLKSKSNVLHE